MRMSLRNEKRKGKDSQYIFTSSDASVGPFVWTKLSPLSPCTLLLCSFTFLSPFVPLFTWFNIESICFCKVAVFLLCL